MRIPFYRPSIGPEEINEVIETLKGGWLTTGPRTKDFERDFAAYMGQKHAVALNSCTAALHLALDAIGLKAGQGVIVPTMTFAATAEVVRYFGARPILADCRTDDFNLDIVDAALRIEAALRAGVEINAIMPVHYGGQVADVDGVQKLARKYDLKVIEDAAHCCPAFYRDSSLARLDSTLQLLRSTVSQLDGASPSTGPATAADPEPQAQLSPSEWLPVGQSADISCYSFYANKTITTGEGGMACTNNEHYVDRMRIMSLHGISRDAWKRFTGEGSWYYEIIAPGYKYNLTDIAAAIGIHQLRKANLFHRRRTILAARYRALLGEVEELILPEAHPDRLHSWHLFAIRLCLERLAIDRAQFIAELKQRGIGASVHWLPLHLHPYYRETYGYTPQELPVATSLYPQLISLPLYPEMTDNDVAYVCDSIKEIIARNLRLNVHSPRRAVPVAQSSL